MKKAGQSTEPKRPYHSLVRQRQAEETRTRILATTRALFAELSYAGTTLENIAERAEVSPKTVTAVFGSKAAILAEIVNPEAFDQLIQELLVDLRAATEPAKRVALVAQITRRAFVSLALELELLRTAPAVVPELEALAEKVELRRRKNQSYLIANLVEQGALRAGLSAEEALDIIWALTSYDVYRMLVTERRWSPERYENWLAGLLIAHLLGSGGGTRI